MIWTIDSRVLRWSAGLVALLFAATVAAKDESSFVQFQKKRPSTDVKLIGEPGSDVTLTAIGEVYGQTIELVDKAAVRAENAKVPLTLARAAEAGYSDEQIQEVVNNLTPEEQEMLDAYLDNEVDTLEVASTYLNSAYGLREHADDIDVKEFINNPLKIPGALKGVHHGGKQINYTIKALEFLNDYRSVLQRAKTFRGR